MKRMVVCAAIGFMLLSTVILASVVTASGSETGEFPNRVFSVARSLKDNSYVTGMTPLWSGTWWVELKTMGGSKITVEVRDLTTSVVLSTSVLKSVGQTSKVNSLTGGDLYQVLFTSIGKQGTSTLVEHYDPATQPALMGRDPISITGDDQFTAANGVMGGSGRANNPYLIAGWEIDHFSGPAAISVANTRAYFVIRNVFLTANPEFSNGISLSNSSHGVIQDVTVVQGQIGIAADSCSDLKIVNVTITADYLHWSRCVVLTQCSNVEVRECTLAFDRGGLWVQQCSNVTVLNTLITTQNGNVPVYGLLSDNLTLVGCTISNNDGGIMIEDCTSLKLVGNLISNNGAYGLVIRFTTLAALYSNVFLGGGVSIQGTDLHDFNTHTIPVNNSVNGAPLFYYKDGVGLLVDSLAVGQVIVANYSSVILSNLAIIGSTVGIQIFYSNDVVVDTCTLNSLSFWGIYAKNCGSLALSGISAVNCGGAINLDGCPGVSILRCPLLGGGINLASCPGTTIVGNLINAADVGINVDDCPNMMVADNYIANCYWYGLMLFGSDKLVLENNTIVRCSYWAVSLNMCIGSDVNNATVTYQCGSATIENNTIGESANGIRISYCVDSEVVNNTFYATYVAVDLMEYVTGFRVYHNNFIGCYGIGSGTVNSWDNGYPSGGNYWSGYVGEDQMSGPQQDVPGADGIGDTPYNSPVGYLVDYYPLMAPWR